ncbi:MAG: MFS transporter [Candidatus Moraniibacteriota bacterium]
MVKQLEGNITKYNYYKIFTKRVYLPLIAIYLIDRGGVNLQELGIIASVTGAVQLMLEVPSGYFADKFGHKFALLLGSFISAISVLPYIFFPGFIGGLVASAGYFGGMTFASGTMQAFMHETLRSLKKDHEYSNIMGRAQSFGLIGNIFLVSFVPLTYKLNPRLPFIIGFFCLFATFLLIKSMKIPEVHIQVQEDGYKRGTLEKLRRISKKIPLMRMFLIFLIFGIVSAGFDQSTMYREVIFRGNGIPVEWFGFFLAIGSLLAAFGGTQIQHLQKISPSIFYFFDAAYLVLLLIVIGLIHNPIAIVLVFALFPAYDRTRNIIFEAQLFDEFKASRYKATLISVMNFFTMVSALWVPLILSRLVSQKGLSIGYIYFGIVLGIILLPILIIQGVTAKFDNKLN